MADYRRMGSAATADLDFRRDLEELVCGHLDGCMSSSTTSSCTAADDDIDLTTLSSTHAGESSARRQSRLISRWVARQTEEVITSMEREVERRNREAELVALARLHPVSTLDSSFLSEPHRRSQSTNPAPPVSSGAPPSILQMWRERIEQSRDENILIGGDGERERERESERVRQIIRRLMAENPVAEREAASVVSARGEDGRSAEWLGETERQRVRSVREWVQTANQQQRDARASRREDRPARREVPRIRGRQARLDVLARMARERERELQGVSGFRAVSEFPHRSRNRIQGLLLRGRFLRNVEAVEEERPPSVSASELGQLRESQRVSTLRYAFTASSSCPFGF